MTWIFANGPRQTIPLDGAHSKHNPADQRPYLWSASRGSNTDFNNNSRNVQGGIGFAGNLPNPNIYDHGIVFGASDALDAQTHWVAVGVRSLRQPVPTDAAAANRGRALFVTNCASCHGGPKWTKSTIFYRDNPAFNENPAAGGVPLDAGVTANGAQIVSFASSGLTFKYLEDVGTFNATNPLEIRADGQRAFGALGFNVPSLIGVNSTAPYFHNGAAPTLDALYPLHKLGAGTIASVLTVAQRQDLTAFLRTIAAETDILRSEADDFRDAVAQ